MYPNVLHQDLRRLLRRVRTSRESATPLESVNAAVATSMDYLKEQLFRLELRHQAGTISDEEYASERARAEKVLRDLVRG